MRLIYLLLASQLACTIGHAAPDPAISLSERREQLGALTQELNSPDPLRRLATLEQALNSNDRIARDVATKVALGSSDAAMRNYAAAYLLSKSETLHLDISLPPEVQSKLDHAGDDATMAKQVRRDYSRVFALLSRSAQHLDLDIQDFQIDRGSFKVVCGRRRDTPVTGGQLSGGDLRFPAPCPGVQRDCSADLQLGAQGIFTGMLACAGMIPVPAQLRLQ